MGRSDGAFFMNNKDIFMASVPKINAKSTIGAGDSVITGFIYTYMNGGSLFDSFKFGVAIRYSNGI